MKHAARIVVFVFMALQLGCSNNGSFKGDLLTTVPAATPTPTPAAALVCPTNYVKVPGEVALGTSDFCIAQYEMRNVAGTATSQAALVPWANASRNIALAACHALGARYDLISNAEWQTAARNIALQSVNWSTGIVGQGMVNFGNGDNGGGGITCDSTNEYVDGGCTPLIAAGNFEAKRTHSLSNGNVVWDMGGNFYEIMKDLSNAGQYGVVGCATDYAAVNPFSDILGTAKNAFGIADATGFALTGCGHLGGLVGATSDNSVTPRAVLRGGSFYDTSGLFSADIGWAGVDDTDGSFSFRCSYK